MSDCILRSRCSIIWKAVAKIWPLLRNNMIWSIGDGHSIRCWEDNWVLDMGPIVKYIPGHINISAGCKVYKIVLGNNARNLNFFGFGC